MFNFINGLKRKRENKHNDDDRIIGPLLISTMTTSYPLGDCVSIDALFNDPQFKNDYQSALFCDMVKEQCIGSVYFNKTNTLLISDSSFDNLLDSINELTLDLSVIDPELHTQVVSDVSTFFDSRKVVVSQGGFVGGLYKLGNTIQSYGSSALAVKSMQVSSLKGVTGSQVLSGQPLLLIAVPTVGGIFFHGISMIAGDTTVGRVSKFAGNICLLPMKGTELVLNNIIFQPIGKITGIPLLLNFTETLTNGYGLSIKDAKVVNKIVKDGYLSPFWKKVRKTVAIWFN